MATSTAEAAHVRTGTLRGSSSRRTRYKCASVARRSAEPMLSPFIRRRPVLLAVVVLVFSLLASASPTYASESGMVLPSLSRPDVRFLGMTGHTLLLVAPDV